MLMARHFLSNAGNFLSRSKTVSFSWFVSVDIQVSANIAVYCLTRWGVLHTLCTVCVAFPRRSLHDDFGCPLSGKWHWICDSLFQVVPLFSATCNTTQHNKTQHH